MPTVPSVAGLREWIAGRRWLHREPKEVVPRRILVVDSNAANRQSTARVVDSLGYESLQTGALEEALKLLEEQDPEFVLLGFDLQDTTGLEALAELRELDPDLPVIMLAADLWDGRTAEAMRQGAVAYLAQPWGPDDLRELLGRR